MAETTYTSENGADNLFFIDLRVYIAGVLIPTNSVYITSAFSNLPTATITLPPYQELFTLGRNDRVPVHIFIVNRFGRDSQDNYQGKEVKEGENKYQIGEPLLIFEGEVSGFGYLSDGGGRDFIINARSHFSFLQDLHIDFILNSEDFLAAVTPGEALAKIQQFASIGHPFPISLFTSGFTMGGVGKDSKPISAPTQLLENMFKLLTDGSILTDLKDPDKNVLYKFYQTYTNDKIKVLKRYPQIKYFDTKDPSVDSSGPMGFYLLNLVTESQWLAEINSFLADGLPATGGTFWDIIYAVFSKMEYELSILNAPTYSPSSKTFNSIIAKPILYDAVPPRCNIIFRNQVKSVRVDEIVHGVPTRIRLRDIYKTLITPNRPSTTTEMWNRLDYYPSKYFTDAVETNTKFKLFSSEMLDIEKYTGPYLYDAAAPAWTTFVNTGQFGFPENKNNDDYFRMSVMQSMLMLKIYEHRQITVTMDYNPFIVVGAPAIVFDVIPNGVNAQGLTFLGYILSAQHSLTRNSMRTILTLGYTRIIQEDFVPDTRLYNSFKPISTSITHDASKMSDIYMTMYGCEAMQTETESQDTSYKEFYDIYYLDGIQNSPKDSYAFQERRLTTMDEYFSYMNITKGKTIKNEDGDEIVLQFTDGASTISTQSLDAGDNQNLSINTPGSSSGYISDRMDKELIGKLTVVQDKCLSNKIYNRT